VDLTCAFCGTTEEDADIQVQERLGVEVAVCAACRARFAAGIPTRPAAPVPEEPRGLPPTLGQQSSAVFELVRRMAQIAADRPYEEQDCPECGHPVHVYPGPDGERIGLAKESVLATSVPDGSRWRVVEGRAEPTQDIDPEDEDAVGARVEHAVVCPANPAPSNPRLARMWHNNLTPPPPEF